MLIRQDKLNFTNSTPVSWMKRQREIQISGLPNADKFIIVNPEEIGIIAFLDTITNMKFLLIYRSISGKLRH